MWGWIKNGRNYMRMRKDGCEDELKMEETIWEWGRKDVRMN